MNSEDSQAQNPVTDPAVNEYRKHMWDALRAGQEQYDKYLLTLSSGGLAISLMLLKDVFGKTTLAYPAILICSWGLFCVCILATVASFLTSQHCLRQRLEKYEACIGTGNFETINDPDRLEGLTNFLNYLSGVCFLLAIIATITFASINLQRGTFMSKELENLKGGYTAPQAPTLHNVKINNGYLAPPAPTTQQQQPTSPPPEKK